MEIRRIDEIEERKTFRGLLDETIEKFVCFGKRDRRFVFIRKDCSTASSSVRVYDLSADELFWRNEVLFRKNGFPGNFYNVFPGEINYEEMIGLL